MESGHPAPGDILQVIPRRTPSGGPPPDGGGTGSRRISLPPARRRALTRVVIGAVGACGLILVAAGVARILRPSDGAVALAATTAIPASPAPAPLAAPVSPPATAAAIPPAAATPQSGTLHLQRPAAPGNVWLDGQKVTTASATVACGEHQLKVGHGKAHAIEVPCGGDVKISR